MPFSPEAHHGMDGSHKVTILEKGEWSASGTRVNNLGDSSKHIEIIETDSNSENACRAMMTHQYSAL